MTLDNEIEKEIESGNMRIVSEENINAPLYRYLISRILEAQGALVTPEGLIMQAMETRTVAIPPEGVYQGYPTMEFLRELDQKYFGKVVPIPTAHGVDDPMSLEQVKGTIYLRSHISYGDFMRKVRELKEGK